jgi:hypothetical protein
MSQDPNTKDYIIVLQDRYCEKCGKKYVNTNNKWCEQCQIDCLKANFTNWTSGNEIVDNLIQEMQLKIHHYKDIIFEWIPYDQFNNINKEVCDDGFASAIWKDGPLDYIYNKYKRDPNKEVALKYCIYKVHKIILKF